MLALVHRSPWPEYHLQPTLPSGRSAEDEMAIRRTFATAASFCASVAGNGFNSYAAGYDLRVAATKSLSLLGSGNRARVLPTTTPTRATC